MDTNLMAFVVVAFLAILLLLEGLWHLWLSRHGPHARRLAERLRRVSAAPPGAAAFDPTSIGSGAWGLPRWPWLERVPVGRRLQRWIDASGSSWSVLDAAAVSAAFAVGAGVLVGLWRGDLPWIAGAAMFGLAVPWMWLAQRRQQRQERIESQFPQALELISRALRAGHALSAAIRMAAEELPDPLVRDFRLLFESLNYGQPLPEALSGFARQVPLADAGYFSVAVIVQRETGGNLAEVLDQIATLVRERLRLRGEVRTLSAEGRLSAVILTALPFGVALVVQVLNPGFLSVLWTDPSGRQMVAASLAGMVLGVVWMRSIIRIRV